MNASVITVWLSHRNNGNPFETLLLDVLIRCLFVRKIKIFVAIVIASHDNYPLSPMVGSVILEQTGDGSGDPTDRGSKYSQ